LVRGAHHGPDGGGPSEGGVMVRRVLGPAQVVITIPHGGGVRVGGLEIGHHLVALALGHGVPIPKVIQTKTPRGTRRIVLILLAGALTRGSVDPVGWKGVIVVPIGQLVIAIGANGVPGRGGPREAPEAGEIPGGHVARARLLPAPTPSVPRLQTASIGLMLEDERDEAGGGRIEIVPRPALVRLDQAQGQVQFRVRGGVLGDDGAAIDLPMHEVPRVQFAVIEVEDALHQGGTCRIGLEVGHHEGPIGDAFRDRVVPVLGALDPRLVRRAGFEVGRLVSRVLRVQPRVRPASPSRHDAVGILRESKGGRKGDPRDPKERAFKMGRGSSGDHGTP